MKLTCAVLLAVIVLGSVVLCAQIGPDQPYMLVYRAAVCPSGFTYTANPAVMSSTSTTLQALQYGVPNWTECPKQIDVEYFPSVEKAIERMNTRGYTFVSQSGTSFTPAPTIASEDVIGLFKVQRIPVSLKPSGKKQKVTRQVPQEVEEDVLEWQP